MPSTTRGSMGPPCPEDRACPHTVMASVRPVCPFPSRGGAAASAPRSVLGLLILAGARPLCPVGGEAARPASLSEETALEPELLPGVTADAEGTACAVLPARSSCGISRPPTVPAKTTVPRGGGWEGILDTPLH